MPAITTPAFDEAYKKLNPAQKKAVDAIDGPVMVIAGPGTGKTQMLTLRIANILRLTDTTPGSILALTFTESAVGSMRKRLVDIIGAPGYSVYISTFHGFCNDIIKRFPDAFPHIIGSTHATEIDQIQIVEEIFSLTSFTTIKPYGDPFYYLRSSMSTIRELKREKISPKDFMGLIKDQEKEFKGIPDLYHEKGAHKGKMKGMYSDLEKKIQKNKELGIVYEKYQEALGKKHLYDYEDMILETIQAFEKNEDLLLQVQEQYQYILADEHQDANTSQNRILELLASFHDNPNIFVVGDEKQAIFRFQGASLENFLYFQKLYPQALIVRLEDNYRSTQTILDASHSLILKNQTEAALQVKLNAKQKHKPHFEDDLKTKITLYEFSNPHFERAFLLKDIQSKIDLGIHPNHIAIIYRDNRDAVPLVQAFEKTTIPFVIQSDQNILNDPHISKFISLLRTIEHFGRNETLAEALYIDFLGLNTLDIYKLLTFSYRQKIPLYDVVRDPKKVEEADVENTDAVKTLYEKLKSWSSCAKNKLLADCFETIVRESGFITYAMNEPNSVDLCAKVDGLFAEARKLSENKKDAKLKDFLRYIDTLETYKVLVKSANPGEGRDGVRLMTAHRSKGLEFDYVYIVGAYDKHWGNKRDMRQFHIPKKGIASYAGNSLEDERRLFYVAMTRAKRQVILSYPKAGEGGEELLRTLFIDEVDPTLLHTIDATDLEKEFAKDHERLYRPTLQRGISVKDKKFLQELFLDQGLSVTAINTFLKCPWDYFFNNLLRIPRVPTKHQLYGIAIHDTLKAFFDAYKDKKEMTAEQAVVIFENNLKKKPLSDEDYAASLEKGKRALSGYFKTYATTWQRNSITEFAISDVPIEFEADGKKKTACIRGVLDKVEVLEGNAVNVVDYKTAEPRSRNEIMGKTKNSEGDYYRQLTFYKLLLSRFEHGRYDMRSGEIDFVEPDKRGNYHKERFEISADEIKELEMLIRKTASDIYSLSFWDSKCDEKECEYCHLRSRIT